MTGERAAPGQLLLGEEQFRGPLLGRAVGHDRIYRVVTRPGADAQRSVWDGIHGFVHQTWDAPGRW